MTLHDAEHRQFSFYAPILSPGTDVSTLYAHFKPTTTFDGFKHRTLLFYKFVSYPCLYRFTAFVVDRLRHATCLIFFFGKVRHMLLWTLVAGSPPGVAEIFLMKFLLLIFSLLSSGPSLWICYVHIISVQETTSALPVSAYFSVHNIEMSHMVFLYRMVRIIILLAVELLRLPARNYLFLMWTNL